MHLLDELKSIVGVVSLDGRISFVNQALLVWSGERNENIVGELLWRLPWFPEEGDGERVRQCYKQAVSGLASRCDVFFQSEKCHLWVELNIHPVLDETNIVNVMFEGVDISHRKASEALQKRYQLSLEETILEQANALLNASELKSEILSNMSHELRTPMNSIIGFTGRVIKKSGDRLEKRQLQNLMIVERNANQLLMLIDGLLDLSKIEAGMMELQLEEFDFSMLVKEVIHLSQPGLEGQDVRLIADLPEEPMILNTDYLKLKQVLINLVNNSIKFTDRGVIKISSQFIFDCDKPKISISVSDTGFGMDKKALRFVFDAFRQVDGKSTRKAGGTGLGLAIVRSFTDLLAGKVNVSSQVDVGTIFEIIIPVNINDKG